MTALTPAAVSRIAGADLSATGIAQAATNGDTFPAGSNTFLRVKNGTSTTCAVTVVAPTSTGPSGVSFANYSLLPVVPITTGDRLYGPFPAYPFGDGSGNVTVNYSTTTSVTVQVLTVPDS